ncbi:bifunctional riboflavin kinase/FAD synthetase [Frateuria aurantia]|uniref:Riboflavin biosynthesis protein n=1 Tax=Frateuria aurantia (strain ATCC 33424 / DSM 6220 / KCTC 2777 / LMG 1558 / NBRC 3245 / NCIMB 13370) TaxID=767434 RepID=H8KYE9_FRAAD|nr:bifunctional riboflavin kinase/FAD synthetase [Frateuria aurantia]AFC86953.1 riboflavin kinase/FMN adenylyltransferase [Frateuria aurantia DSM 6220]
MTLRLQRDIAGSSLAPAGSVVAIGVFDGLHRGHQALLALVRRRADERGLVAAAISFEPLPRAFFSTTPVARLSTLRERIDSMSGVGIETGLMLRFNRELREMSAETFVRQILVGRLNAREVWVGEGFRFGHGRHGDLALLQQLGAELGFVAQALPTVSLAGERISSTQIRQALQDGNFQGAAKLLGRPFVIAGRVERGQQLGRTLGYPTANVHLRRRVSPIQGIFAVRIGVGDGPCSWPGVASLGVRPTVNEVAEPLLEAHLFDFSGDLYGRRIAVEFVAKLRNEEKFDGLDALKVQMRLDEKAAREVLGMSPILINS